MHIERSFKETKIAEPFQINFPFCWECSVFGLSLGRENSYLQGLPEFGSGEGITRSMPLNHDAAR